MTDSRRMPDQGVSQKPPCLMNHEEMYLTWRNQGNGYNYFFCSHCEYVKFDFESGKIKAVLDLERQRADEAEKEIEKLHKWDLRDSASYRKTIDAQKETIERMREAVEPVIENYKLLLKIMPDLNSDVYEKIKKVFYPEGSEKEKP